MTAPRTRIKFVRGRWEKIEPKPAPVETVSGRLIDVIHHLNARVTSLETALAKLTITAAQPKRVRKPSVAPQGN